ncbi:MULTISPECIES: MFS transporter [unclassified Polaromonas]|uniref:MFS transporter n=1 Tax=unclassified Polaromonas TaxID=2638319 RepID=UPI000BD3D048|nr:MULTISPECIES: MFS transporter [unclassified Polaromonas]OYY38495.1 MAG: MFS transporter [Polaromonas sp. 35-63-35]OYZ21347.1 MAG: MFS transporter [Polaromonas sp. 16-63-31]OYZ79101.1 MAG: MFS transporter [Polaromonas sp. 24-63-21]OZA50233.1 MAG: MFS transporter [Polaromonas sp. 17-63-33]OZA89269.1 MAG: MFS transporter [Polaromonas sp. 39-63-25]
MNTAAPGAFGTRNGLAYGLLGLPLAFVALPLYVILPNHYAREFGVPLATLGAVLLGARLFDALIDPLLGRLSDRLFARSARAVLGLGAVAALVLALGFALLFFPLVSAPSALVVWASLMLMLTYAGYSALSVSHQSWGAMLGGDERQRSRIVAWREGLGLVGVVLASITPVVFGLPASTALFFVALTAGWLAWARADRPVPRQTNAGPHVATSIWLPFRQPGFRRLLVVFLLNGTASAVPATLVLFFIQDRLQAPSSQEPLFLGSYFVSAALSIPLWLALVKRIGLAPTWLVGMLVAIATFGWATQIAAGDTVAFVVVCALSGIALGTDLALPGALLAGVIQANGQSGRAEGAYFGWWNFAIKLNLALAAGLALPLLALFGYAPGARDAQALSALLVAYCVLPCLLKLAAAACLYFLVIKHPQGVPP